MPFFKRQPRLLPLQLPRLDATSWTDPDDVGRPSFAANALYQMGYREAFEPEAIDIADLLIDEILPQVRIAVAPEDEPYLRSAFTAAAQIGAGIGIVERRTANPDEGSTDRDIGGALWVARRDLPAMPPPQRRVALYLLQSGYYVARTHPAAVALLLAALEGEDQGSGSSAPP